MCLLFLNCKICFLCLNREMFYIWIVRCFMFETWDIFFIIELLDMFVIIDKTAAGSCISHYHCVKSGSNQSFSDTYSAEIRERRTRKTLNTDTFTQCSDVYMLSSMWFDKLNKNVYRSLFNLGCVSTGICKFSSL